jgi:transcriptional regulator with XRE-family HTH domain
MIKNDIQLKNAQSRIERVVKEIEQYQRKLSGLDLELHVAPLIDEEEELMQEISEYLTLRKLPFEEAVKKLSKEPLNIGNIGELLSKLRIAAGLTQKDLAEKLGWEQSNLSRFESENYNSQTISKIVEIASHFGVWLLVIPSMTEKVPEVTYITLPAWKKTRRVTNTSSLTYEHDISEDITEAIDYEKRPQINELRDRLPEIYRKEQNLESV